MSIVIESGTINTCYYSIRINKGEKSYHAIITDRNNVVILDRHYTSMKSARQAIKRNTEGNV